MNQLLLISKLMEKYIVLLMHERGMEFGWRPQVDVGREEEMALLLFGCLLK